MRESCDSIAQIEDPDPTHSRHFNHVRTGHSEGPLQATGSRVHLGSNQPPILPSLAGTWRSSEAGVIALARQLLCLARDARRQLAARFQNMGSEQLLTLLDVTGPAGLEDGGVLALTLAAVVDDVELIGKVAFAKAI